MILGILRSFIKGFVIFVNVIQFSTRYIITNRIWDDKVAIRKSLHQRAGTEAICAVVRKIRFAGNKQTGNITLKVVINPEPTHRIVHSGEDLHGLFVRIFAGDIFVHIKKIPVLAGNRITAVTFNRISKIKVNCSSGWTNPHSIITNELGISGGHITRHEVSKSRIFLFQVIISILFGNVVGMAIVIAVFRYPNTSIVTETLAHQRKLGLIVPGYWNAGRVNLHIAGIRKTGTPLVTSPSRRHVRILSIGRQIKSVAVSATGQHNRIGHPAFNFSGYQVAGNNTASLTVNLHQIQHFVAGVHFDLSLMHLTHHRLIGTEHQLLTRLSTCIKRSRNLGSTKRSVRQQTAIFTGKRHALRYRLVNNFI